MPSRTLHFTVEEVSDILRAHVEKHHAPGQVSSGYKVIFKITAGLSGNDPRERHTPDLTSIDVELD